MPRKDPGISYRPHHRLKGALEAGTVIAAGTTAYVTMPIAGAEKVRVRAKVDAAADLLLRIMKAPPNADEEYDANQPTDVALTADTEDEIEKTDLAGEAYARIGITAGGADVTVAYVEVCQL